MLRPIEIAICCLVIGCATESERRADEEGERYSAALKRLDTAIERLGAIESTVANVLARNRIVIRVPKHETLVNGTSSTFAPSEVVRRFSARSQATSSDAALVALLRDARDGKQISRAYGIGCDDGWGEPHELNSIDRSIYKEPIATQLDAVAFIQFESCIESGAQPQRINSPAASLPTDTDSFALAAEAQKARDKALNKPFQIPTSDRLAILMGQTFRFASANDADIPLSSYVSQLFQAEATRLNQLYAPVAERPFQRFTFDRYVIAEGSQSIQESQKGWFNGLGVNGIVYISPTFARAAVIACAKNVERLPALRARLDKEIRPKLKERSHTYTYNDVRGITQQGEQIATAMDNCVTRQASFLIAHELGHALVGLNEGHADCLAVATLRLSGQSDLGIFGTVLFDVLNTNYETVLRISPEGRRLLKLRKEQLADFQSISSPDLRAALQSCQLKKVAS